jgi:transposase InsO family protein
MEQTFEASLAVNALKMAVAQRRPAPALMVHSDRGSQVASEAFRNTLKANQLVASMSRKANCYDNAHMESFWSSLKYEVVYHRTFATRSEARSAIFDYIESFYNRTRLHSSLGYQSPVQFESQLNLIKSPSARIRIIGATPPCELLDFPGLELGHAPLNNDRRWRLLTW